MSLASPSLPVEAVAALDDLDRDIVDALQIAPRVPAAALASVLDLPTSTVHRRLQRLEQEHLLRVVGRYAWELLTDSSPYELWIRVVPGRSREVADALLAFPQIQLAMETTGDADVFATLFPLRGSDEYTLLTSLIPQIPGVRSAESRLIIDSVRIAQSWRTHRLDDARSATLGEHRVAVDGPPLQSIAELTEVEFGAMQALGRDARASAAEVARDLGVSPSTASRAIQRLLRSGAVLPRVEIDPQHLGFPLQTLISLDVAPAAIAEVTTTLAEHPRVRMVSIVTGPMPVSVHGAFHSPADFARFLHTDLAALPGVNGFRTALILRVGRRFWIDRVGDRLGEQVSFLSR